MSNDIIPVGYKVPPQHTRFKKGQSGNPKGRPRIDKSLISQLSLILNQKIVMQEKDGPKKVTLQEALIYAQVKKGLSGNTTAFKQLINMLPPDKIAPEKASITVEFVRANYDND